MRRFTDKVVLITGAAKGLGKETARLFAEEGARISISDIDYEGIEKLENEFTSKGYDVFGLKADISKLTDIEKMISKTVKSFGQLDILINNAAAPFQKPMMEINWEDWDLVLNVNIKGTFHVLKAAASEMIKKGNGGSIVNISSLAGSGGRPLYVPYAASKAAVMNITQSAAKELAKYNIRVNSISPGNIESKMLTECAENVARIEKTKLEDILDLWRGRIPLEHMAKPEEIAKTILMVCSDDASYITGQIINACGGLSIP